MGKGFRNGWVRQLFVMFIGMAALAASAAPTIIQQPQSQTVAVGTNVTFTVGAFGAAPISFQWRCFFYIGDIPAVVVVGGNSSILVLSDVQLTNCGRYYVVVTDSRGSTTSQYADLTVMRPPFLATVDDPCPKIASENQPFSVPAVTYATAPFWAEWRVNGSVLTNKLVPPPWSGAYNCASNQVALAFDLNRALPVGENFVEIVVTNAVGRNSRLFVLETIPNAASDLTAAGNPQFCPPTLTLSRGLAGIYTNAGSGFCDRTNRCGTSSNSSWYQLVTLNSGLVTVSTEGSSGDTLLAVLKGLPISCSSLTNVECNNDVSAINKQSRLQFQAQASNIYFVAVGRLNSTNKVKLTYGYEPQIASFGFRPDRSFELQTTMAPPLSYRVQDSVNLQPGSWTTVFTTNLPTTGGVISFRDSRAPAPKQRFYRLAAGP